MDDLLNRTDSKLFYAVNEWDEKKRLDSAMILSQTWTLLAYINSEDKSKAPSYPSPWDIEKEDSLSIESNAINRLEIMRASIKREIIEEESYDEILYAEIVPSASEIVLMNNQE